MSGVRAATVELHVKHLRRALDRLFTYARGESLRREPMAHLR